MANLDQPRGFRPAGTVLSASAYRAGGTIYPGDLVKLNSDGNAVVVEAGDASCGAALSYATSGQDVIVADDPSQKFVAQADDASIDAQTDINLNYNVLATAGSVMYKMSRMEIDASTGATTATLPLKVLSVERRVDNELGASVECVVKINNHQLAGSTGTAGV